MSLINDALKRAKDAQQKSPAVAPGPHLRPAEPKAAVAPARGMAVPIIVILIVLGGGVFFWLERQKTVEKSPAETKISAAVDPVPPSKPPVQPATISIPSAATNPPAPTQPTASAITMPKLQAIFFVPGHSSAIINGKTVRAGDKVQGFRVAVIDQNSATLVSATQTNVMTLEQ
ncbi:MAG TPA: hypothetical protein VGI88_06355 [Verrucomicrobiae bacterium]|jgi:hypothetical protein